MLPIELPCILFFMCSFLKQSKQYENLTLGKPVIVSESYNNRDFEPSLAVDGDVSTKLLKCTLTASGQKEAWLTVDLEEVKNIASISFLHGGLGSNGTVIDPSYSFVNRSSNGNGTLLLVNGSTICPLNFEDQNARVVCLSWGYLPDNATLYDVPLDNVRFTNGVYLCTGSEPTIKKCKVGRCNLCNSFAGYQKFLSCKSGNTLAGFSVYVSETPDWKSGTLCYQHDMTKPVDNNISVDCFTTGRYVTVFNSRNGLSDSTVSDFAYINICELNITGCGVGHYGENCSICPVNCLNSTCHVEDGDCFNCEDGFTGARCDKECMTGWYGKGCAFPCGQCLNQEPCDHVNGSCPFGCSPGWKGNYCNQQCESGYFGLECNSTCNNTNCQNSTDCEPVFGQCAVDCIKGWAGAFCEECDPTYYGEQCNNSCSDFCQNKLCNHTTGQCFSCNGFRNGVFCENEKLQNTAAVTAQEIPFTAVGAIFAVFVLVLLVLVLVCLIIRRKRRLDTKTEDAIGLTQVDNPMPERKTNFYHDGTNGGVREDLPLEYNNFSYVTHSTDSRFSEQEETGSEAETRSESPIVNLNDVELLSENLGEIPIPELHDYILRKHGNMDEGFKAEYKALPEGDISRCTIGGREKNVPSNRYRNTLPYDHSRVILSDPNGEDYINANYIPNVQGDQKYIACQGPKPTTVKDLWRMIWQEEVHNVVMLTNTVEGDKRKCEQYWPSRGKTIISAKMTFTNVKEKEYAFYTIRKLQISNTQGEETEIQQVNHFHFTGWPDHGVPSTSQLLSFYHRVRKQLDKEKMHCPVVVHCSAGVGRTGTFIAIDALAQNGLTTGTVNVTKYVSKMRRERMHMIQTTGQYITVYKCLDEFFNFPPHVISIDDLPHHSTSKDFLREEFQEISNFMKKQQEFKACNALSEVDEDSSCLIIAEYPSLWVEDGFLISRHPLPRELNQFLSIISDVIPSVVIVLDADQSTTEEWIPEGQHLVVDRYVVEKTKSRVVSVNRRMTTIGVMIQHGNDEEVEFRIIEPVASQDSDYSNVTHLSDIIDAFTSVTLQKDYPVVILNNDNSVEVLTTVIVINALQQLWEDGETDLSFFARYFQSIQEAESLSFDDYLECYRLVNKFANKMVV